ncbi:hypothetical protein TRIUR3_02049 [Triticum urartu]|uniref:Uncharacterized protein n=2 Tax=Triticum urartu TaxID=4572 RepID=M7ZS22_TRIUA|nr:uncharacterized protein ECU03_1610-like [Triticum urartu]EMS62426.1 hypothetical protein TRIUR3_02049 [Triticum urartu]
MAVMSRLKRLAAPALLVLLALAASTTQDGAEAAPGKDDESWTGWAKDKISEGLGLDKISEGLGLKHDADEEAARETVQHTASETGSQVSGKAADAKEAAKGTVGEKAGAAKDAVLEKTESAKDAAWATAEAAKGKANEGYEKMKEKWEAVGATKEKLGEVKDMVTGAAADGKDKTHRKDDEL